MIFQPVLGGSGGLKVVGSGSVHLFAEGHAIAFTEPVKVAVVNGGDDMNGVVLPGYTVDTASDLGLCKFSLSADGLTLTIDATEVDGTFCYLALG